MNKIWQIIKTEFQIEFAYPMSWVFFLVLPIIFTMVIGAALGGSRQADADQTQEDIRPVLAVIDLDQSFLSGRLYATLAEGDVVKTVQFDTINDISDETKQTTGAFLTIPAGFEQALLGNLPLSLSLDIASESFTSVAIENEIRSALNHTAAALMAVRSNQIITNGELTDTDLPASSLSSEEFTLSQDLIEENPLFILETHEGGNDQDSPSVMMGFNQSSSGQLVTWSLITLLGGSIIFVRDRNDGSYQRIFTTPTRRSTYFIGKVLARMLMGLVQMTILVIFGLYILHVDWGNDPVLLLGFLTCFSFAGTTLGLMLGAFCKTTKQADNLTTLLSMLMAALGGAWWPLEITPTSYQAIVRVIPSTWAMLGFNDIIIKGQGFDGVLLEGGVLIGFAAIFMVIGILQLNRKMN